MKTLLATMYTKSMGVFVSFALAGCVTITQPPDNATNLQQPIVAEVGFRSQMCAGTFQATLTSNNVTPNVMRNVTQLFNPQPPATTLPRANLTGLTQGSHTLRVSAETLQYWLLIPFCGASSDSVTFSVAAPPLPTLRFSPAGPLSIDAGSTAAATVTVPSASSSATMVNLSSSNTNNVTLSANTTNIPANQTSSGQVVVTGQVGGSANVTASATGFQSGSLGVNVRPVVASLNPISGLPGTTVSVSGIGFANGATVRFGSQAAATTFVSASQLNAVVPNVAAGQRNVTVVLGGQTSNTGVNFQVLAAPPPAATLLFRTSGQDVQTFSFTSGSFSLLDTDSATPQGGTAVVSVAFNGLSNVVRTSAGDVQSFNLAANNTLAAAGGAPAPPSGTGAAIAAAGNLVVRASDVGLDTYLLSGGMPQRQTTQTVAGSLSATGVAVDLSGSFAVRAHATGVDMYNVANASSPILVGSAGTVGLGVSSVGVGVKFAPGGGVAVRSNPGGIDVYTIAVNGTPSRAGSFLTGVVSSAINTAVAVNATGTRAVRAHSTGIEVYDISNPAAPQRIGQRSGATSTTGVGAFIVGSTMFRGMNTALEAYDISNPAAIPAPTSIAATPSSIGVGLSGR